MKTPVGMSLAARWVLGIVVGVLAFGGAAVLSATQRASLLANATREAQERTEAAWGAAAAALRDQARQLADQAGVVAAHRAVIGLVQSSTGHSDLEVLARTFSDLRKTEAWFSLDLAQASPTVFLGSTPVFTEVPELTADLERLVTVAAAAGRAHDVVALGSDAWLLGAARSEAISLRSDRGFVALARRLTVDDLRALSPSAVARLETGTEAAAALATGGGEAMTRLEAARASLGGAGGDPCCVWKELAPGIALGVFEDPGPILEKAEADAAQGRWPRVGVAALVTLLAAVLLAALGRRPAADDEARDVLLRDAQAQLKQSQDVLQKLSTGAFATQAAAGASVAPMPLSLDATAASPTPSRYEVIAPLGEGGMARVSVAMVRGAEGFKRTFVLKRLKATHASNQELVNQFIDEARLGASLVHSNIVPVFDFGRDAEGYYLAQEYILGRDVGALVEASVARRGRPLEAPLVALIAQEALKALAYAHTRTDDAGQAAGLVHRDVSPANLMVSARGEVKLLDFGIVKSADRVTQTQAGMVKGNLFYMAPEQARALPVDERADLFALAMVMTTAALGRTLYSGASMYELMTRAAAGPTPEDLEAVRAGAGSLATFLVKGLAVDPALRFQSAAAMAQALTSVVPAAPASELEALMRALFQADLDADRQRFSGAA